MSYNADGGTTDNPALRNFDWTRRMYSIPIENTKNDTIVIPALESVSLFSGYRTHGIIAGDMAELISKGDSIYRLQTLDGTPNFRTKRITSNITSCNITINNHAVAVFDFVGATISAFVGDTIHVKGYNTKDANLAFSPINTGNWLVIGVSGSKLSCRRPIGEEFVGIEEQLATVVDGVDFEIFSPSGVQISDTIKIKDWLVFGEKTFKVQSVTSSWLEFLSGEALPTNTPSTYESNKLSIYSNSKRFVYLESNQPVAVMFNDSVDQECLIEPVDSADTMLPGFMSKFGSIQSCTIVNKSIEPATVVFCTAE